MKYEVTFICGHKGMIELFGPGKERERRLNWVATHKVCPECERSRSRQEYILATANQSANPANIKPHSQEADFTKRAAERAEKVVIPVDKTHDGVVNIMVTDDKITARYVRDDDFIKIVRSLHYRWDPTARKWYRKMNIYSGLIGDRVAELGHRLLSAGFAVEISDAEQRRRAVAAEYNLECRRWVSLYVGGDYSGYLCIRWDREDDLFSRIKLINGAHWHKDAMAVPITSYDEVLDMANILEFRFTEAARETINEYRKHLTKPVTPAPAPQAEELPDRLGDILASSEEVIDDLKDD